MWWPRLAGQVGTTADAAHRRRALADRVLAGAISDRGRPISIGHGTSATPVSRVGGENTMSSVATRSTDVSA